MQPAKKTVAKKCPHGKQPYYCRDCGGKGICLHGKHRHSCAECQDIVCPVPACNGRKFSGARGLQCHIDFWHSNRCWHRGEHGAFCTECPRCQENFAEDSRYKHRCAVPLVEGAVSGPQ